MRAKMKQSKNNTTLFNITSINNDYLNLTTNNQTTIEQQNYLFTNDLINSGSLTENILALSEMNNNEQFNDLIEEPTTTINNNKDDTGLLLWNNNDDVSIYF